MNQLSEQPTQRDKILAAFVTSNENNSALAARLGVSSTYVKSLRAEVRQKIAAVAVAPSYCPYCGTKAEIAQFVGSSPAPAIDPSPCENCGKSWALQDSVSKGLRQRLLQLSDDDLWLILQLLHKVLKNLALDVVENAQGGKTIPGRREGGSNWSMSHVSRVLNGERKSKPTEYAITQVFRRRLEQAGILQFL